MEYSIKEQFAGQHVLLTGATGYLGSLVLECLLRTTEVAGVHVLLRASGSRTPQQRLEQLLSKNLYHKVRDQKALVSKVHAVAGDLSLPGLGLEPGGREQLLGCVSIVLHSAADIRLEAPIQNTLRVNYWGTQAVLELAAAMPQLRAMVHVSSAFVNMNQPRSSIVDEKLYPLHYGTRRVSAQEVVQELMALQPAAANNRAHALAQRWGFPNNYTLGKHLTEQLVAAYREAKGLPVAIVRPSLVCAVAFEPIPGYIGNWAGPIGAAAAMATGLYHSLTCVSSRPLHVWDVVPGDMAAAVVLATAAAVATGVDGSIAAAADAAQERSAGGSGASTSGRGSSGSARERLLVVHACSSSTYPMTLMEGWDHGVEFLAAHPPKFRIATGTLPRMPPDFTPRPEVVKRERRWIAFKVAVLCWLLRLFGLRAAAQRLSNGFQALCVYGTAKTDKDLVFTAASLEQLEAALRPGEQQDYLLVWRPGVNRPGPAASGAGGAAAAAGGAGQQGLSVRQREMSWQRFNYTQLAGVYSMLYKVTVPSRAVVVGPDGSELVVEHDFKYVK